MFLYAIQAWIKGRYCFFSEIVLLRVGTSGWFIMTLSSVHQKGRLSPWREEPAFCFSIWMINSNNVVQIRSVAPVLPPAWIFAEQSSFHEIVQRSLDCGTRKPQLQCDGLDGRPAATLAVCPVLKVHIDTSGPVAQIGSIDISKAVHSVPLPQGRKAVLRESGLACIP